LKTLPEKCAWGGDSTALAVFLIGYPRLFIKYTLWSLPFFFMNVAIEVVGVRLGHWSFPGSYIGEVTLMRATFPIEELLFWMIFSTPLIFAWYRGFMHGSRAQ
jgi:hypothetical protein